jgi:hypothetical protein
MHTPHLKLTFLGCSLKLCHLSFFLSPPSSLLTSVVANEQGVDKGESVAGTDRMSDSIVNNTLFGVGGWCTGRARAVECMSIAFVYF